MSLREQAIKRHQNELAAHAVPMSHGDGLTIHQSQAEAPGVYIDSMQNQQDVYAAMIAGHRENDTIQGLDMNSRVSPINSPNTIIIAKPTQTMASPDGNYIINVQ